MKIILKHSERHFDINEPKNVTWRDVRNWYGRKLDHNSILNSRVIVEEHLKQGGYHIVESNNPTIIFYSPPGSKNVFAYKLELGD